MRYYVYSHTRLDKNEIFYIGIGDNISGKYERAYDKRSRNRYWNFITKNSVYNVHIEFLSDSLEEVKTKEIELIKYYGRKDLGLGTLCNLTNGGDGTFGLKPTEEQREKMRIARKNNVKRGVISFGKKIYQYCCKTGVFIRSWDTIKSAADSIGVTKSALSKVIKYNLNKNYCAGYLWFSDLQGIQVMPRKGIDKLKRRKSASKSRI